MNPGLGSRLKAQDTQAINTQDLSLPGGLERTALTSRPLFP